MHRFTSSIYSFCMATCLCATPILAQEIPQNTHGISDPYIQLENDNDSNSQQWLKNQRQLFDHYVQNSPEREELKKRVKDLVDHETYSIPIPLGNKYLFKRRLPAEEQAILYMQDGIHGRTRVLVDPNQLSKDYPVALTDYVPSPNGQYLAYGLAEKGSDWTTWRILNLSTGENQTDCLERIKFFPVAWTPDSSGFYYSRLDSDNIFRIYFHRLGSSQETDQVIPHNFQSPEYHVEPFMSSNGQFLMLDIRKGSSGPNLIVYLDLNDLSSSFHELTPVNGYNYSYICNRDSHFYLWTNQDAPLGKIVTADPTHIIHQDFIKEWKYPLTNVAYFENHLFLSYSDNVKNRLFSFDFEDQQLREIVLPEMGQVSFLDSNIHSSKTSKEFFFSFTHFTQPSMIYRYSIESDQLCIFKKPMTSFDSQDYLTRQVFFTSKDGTQVPMFIVHKKDLPLDEPHPTLLYGYGGFNISLYPFYSALHMAWIESGGIFAVANIRGGSEYGEEWHQGGRGKNKQNCFDDFIGAAEWLIAKKYTNSSKLAIRGRSNGGLLTAVCINQRPDLFGAALVEVGVLDMLRFNLFTVGRFWISEYGNPQDPEDFEVLRRYSPYHNVRIGEHYPSTLITTADHDDRVVPLHSYKYAAALQNAQAGNGKILLRVDTQAGHGAGKSISQWVDEAADILLFLKNELR